MGLKNYQQSHYALETNAISWEDLAYLLMGCAPHEKNISTQFQKT